MNWTDERVEKLKRLWAEGLSASQIASQLGGVSRNAVIGKVHRLNLPGRVKAGGNNAAASRTPKRPAAPAQRPAPFAARPAQPAARPGARPMGALAVKEEIEVEAAEPRILMPTTNVVVPLAKRLALTELTERTCKWPMGDPLKDDFHFCGAESPDNSPYCKYHGRLAYQPVTERRKSANLAARA
jgi:GcrA cell cycle regulator